MEKRKEILILGLGAIGSNVAKNLILADENLIINGIDKDRVEKRNLFTQVYRSRHVGQPKAVAFQMEIAEKTGMQPHGKFILTELKKSGLDYFNRLDLIIDCFDNWQSRIYAQEYAERMKCNILRLGFDFINDKPLATSLWNHKPEDSNYKGKTIDVCDLQEWSYWVAGVAGIFTGEVLNFIRRKSQRDLLIKNNFQIVEI